MADSRLKAHLPALGFFGAAFLFYLIGSQTPAVIFVVIGFVAEIAGWIYLAGSDKPDEL
jgi:hypothetical protein